METSQRQVPYHFPLCRYGQKCTRKDCRFVHKSSTQIRSSSINNNNRQLVVNFARVELATTGNDSPPIPAVITSYSLANEERREIFIPPKQTRFIREVKLPVSLNLFRVLKAYQKEDGSFEFGEELRRALSMGSLDTRDQPHFDQSFYTTLYIVDLLYRYYQPKRSVWEDLATRAECWLLDFLKLQKEGSDLTLQRIYNGFPERVEVQYVRLKHEDPNRLRLLQSHMTEIERWLQALLCLGYRYYNFDVIAQRYVLVNLMGAPWQNRYSTEMAFEKRGNTIIFRRWENNEPMSGEQFERMRQGSHWEWACLDHSDWPEHHLLTELILGDICVLFNAAPDGCIPSATSQPVPGEQQSADSDYKPMPLVEGSPVQVFLSDRYRTSPPRSYVELKKYHPNYEKSFAKLLSTWSQAVLGGVDYVTIGVAAGDVVQEIHQLTSDDLEELVLQQSRQEWTPIQSWNALRLILSNLCQVMAGAEDGIYLLIIQKNGKVFVQASVERMDSAVPNWAEPTSPSVIDD